MLECFEERGAERFCMVLAVCEADQEGLRLKYETPWMEITAIQATSDKAKQFTRVEKKFTEIQELTPEIVTS